MDGAIDFFDYRSIIGWVKRKDTIEPIEIDVFINNRQVICDHPANIMRDDLVQAGIGHGQYGFIVPLPIMPIEAGEVEITIRPSKGQHEPLVQRVTPVKPPPDTNLMEAYSTFRCNIETATPDVIRGWSTDTKDQGRIYDIEVHIDGTFFSTVCNDHVRTDLQRKGLSNGAGGFLVNLPLAWFEVGEHVVTLRLPDGKTVEKAVAVQQKKRTINLALSAEPLRRLSVVIPVYNAVDDVEICIKRLISYTSPEVDILFIDDASPDPRIALLLEEAVKRPNMRMLRNAVNIGFTCTVNRALAETGGNDVIILNSDARVVPGWAEGMMMAARSGSRIATVTAMSDRAGAFSAPNIGNDNPLPEGVDEITYARAFRRHSIGLYPSVPTGNGFCMFINRACIDEIGVLDTVAFARGYGEENDFCMRAGRAGWRSIIDDRTYVFHDRSKSFGDAKTELMAAGRAIVDDRYPEYAKAIGVFSSGSKIGVARLRARQAADACRANSSMPPRVLFVVSTKTGGTPQTNKDLMTGLSDAVDGWILRCDSKSLELSSVIDGQVRVCRTHVLEEAVDPISHASMEYDAVVSDWLLGLDPDIVHIRHLGWHGLSLPRIAKNLGLKVIFSFHDYYSLCPTVKLLDENNIFCGGLCTPTQGECQPELWPKDSLPGLKHKWVYVWRERFAKALEPCDAFITTSDSARRLVLRHMPSLPADRFLVIPHGRDFAKFHRLRQRPVHGEPLRILVPGNINAAKGLEVIDALIEHDKAGLLEFHVIGDINMVGRAHNPQLITHGKYARDEFAAKAAPIRPHLGAVFSVWDETYCHTLTELWSVGLPTIVFDYPTVANRVRKTGAGWVMNHHDILALYEQILRVAFDDNEQRRTDDALSKWQAGDGAGNTIRLMAAAYLAAYRDVLRHPDIPPGTGTKARVAVVCPTGKSLSHPNASTLIRVWERTRNDIARDVSYIRMTPESLLANVRSGAIDSAIIQRTAIPRTLLPEVLDAFADTSIPFIFELDDDLLNVPAEKDPSGVYLDYRPFLKRQIIDAARVTVSTPYLKKNMFPYNKEVSVLPNFLSDRLWSAGRVSSRPGTYCNVLYMGTKTHDADLEMIMPALVATAALYPLFRLTIIGITADKARQFDDIDWIEDVVVPNEVKPYDKFVPWLRTQSAQYSFGIAPLEDSIFNAGKSALKILDYAALGLPVLASDVSAYRKMGSSAPSVALVPNTVPAWTEALSKQIRYDTRNSQAGVELRRWVRNTHMLSQNLAEYDEMILSSTAKSVCKSGIN